MKVVICALNSKFVHSTLAPWYLKAAAGSFADCVVVEGTVNESFDQLYERILKEKPDKVAFSTYIWNVKIVLILAEHLKNELGTEIVLGGPEVSYNAGDLLEKYPFVDCIISGEGEKPFAQLCKGEPYDKIDGLCYKKLWGVSIKPPCISFDDPPNPYTDEYFERLVGRIAYIETSRGCPFSCAFCLSGRCGGVRFFDLEESKRRILLLANSGTQTVKFIDRTFNADRKRARKIFSFIIEKYGREIPKGVCFHFEIEGELLDDETFELLKTAPSGLFQFEIGVQSFNGQTLSSINRKCNLDKLCKNISKVIELGNIHTHIDLIAGLPYEDVESFKKSFNLAYALKPHMLQLGFLKLLHGSSLRAEATKLKIDFTDTPPYEIRSTQWMTSGELSKLHILEDVFEKMYNSRRFGLTCSYLDSLTDNHFDMYAGFAQYVADYGVKNTLDDFTKAIFDFFTTKAEVDKKILRDTLAIDRLATNRMGALPDFLKVKCENLKKTLNFLEESTETKRKKNVKRAACALLTEKKIAYVDYDECNYVTNRFLVKFTKICDN